MFRKIDVDFEDEELKDLACEGVESMLIDWQQGFLGQFLFFIFFLHIAIIDNLILKFFKF